MRVPNWMKRRGHTPKPHTSGSVVEAAVTLAAVIAVLYLAGQLVKHTGIGL